MKITTNKKHNTDHNIKKRERIYTPHFWVNLILDTANYKKGRILKKTYY